VLQGAEPQKIVLKGSACSDTRFAEGIPITSTETIARTEETGWFDLHDLYRRLVTGVQQ
jgi:hypothetical protein